jgi:hypothetical protein
VARAVARTVRRAGGGGAGTVHRAGGGGARVGVDGGRDGASGGRRRPGRCVGRAAVAQGSASMAAWCWRSSTTVEKSDSLSASESS